MTLTVLVSVSLLALVSTARPILPVDDDPRQVHLSSKEPAEVQHAVQAVLESHTGHIAACLECADEDVRVRLTSAEEQQAYLSQLAAADVKALVHLGQNGVHTADEQDLVDILHRLETDTGRLTPVPDDVLDAVFAHPMAASGGADTPAAALPGRAAAGPPSTTRLLALTASCAAALLVLSCVAAVLYITEVVRARVLASANAWELLPRLEKRGGGGYGGDAEGVRGGKGVGLIEDAAGSRAEKGVEEENEESEEEAQAAEGTARSSSPPAPEDAAPTPGEAQHCELEKDYSAHADADVDEKSDDAGSAYATPLVSVSALPPASPAWAPHSLPPSPRRAAPTLRVPDAHPPALPVLPMRRGGAGAGAGVGVGGDGGPGRGRAFAAVPELDAALAMQLRPGLGVGADAAWLVRFVMAFFGWFGVLVSGGRA